MAHGCETRPALSSRDLNDAADSLASAFLHIQRAFEITFPDYELRPTCTYRSPAEQKIEFDAGRSEIDGVTKLGKHNHHPSQAIDVGIFVRQPHQLPSQYLDDILEAAKARGDARYSKLLTNLHASLYWNIGQLAQKMGFRFGGDWRDEGVAYQHTPRDPYHWEVRGIQGGV